MTHVSDRSPFDQALANSQVMHRRMANSQPTMIFVIFYPMANSQPTIIFVIFYPLTNKQRAQDLKYYNILFLNNMIFICLVRVFFIRNICHNVIVTYSMDYWLHCDWIVVEYSILLPVFHSHQFFCILGQMKTKHMF